YRIASHRIASHLVFRLGSCFVLALASAWLGGLACVLACYGRNAEERMYIQSKGLNLVNMSCRVGSPTSIASPSGWNFVWSRIHTLFGSETSLELF
ncbi:hypothetical protein F5Y17DRAFT_444274, partial [Xylariaceae sp. FL0594]